jgi:hypothetical protein
LAAWTAFRSAWARTRVPDGFIPYSSNALASNLEPLAAPHELITTALSGNCQAALRQQIYCLLTDQRLN